MGGKGRWVKKKIIEQEKYTNINDRKQPHWRTPLSSLKECFEADKIRVPGGLISCEQLLIQPEDIGLIVELWTDEL